MATTLDRTHWLDKAEPIYVPANKRWRVRLMRKGVKYQWWMMAGIDDPSSTGKALAHAEWSTVKGKIIADEHGVKNQLGVQKDGSFKALSDDMFDEPDAVETYASQAEYKAVVARQSYHAEWQDSPFADRMSLDEYVAYQEWLASRRAPVKPANSGRPVKPSETLPKGVKPFRDLLNVWREALKLTQAGTIKGMDDGDGMGKSRLEQYGFSIDHMVKTVGHVSCEPLGTFHISDLQLETVLETYRDKCKSEVATYQLKKARGRGEHWFNEKMKAARKLTTYLVQSRLCNGTPAAIERVTKKFKVKSKAKPIPLPVLRAYWKTSDDRFKTFMLLALNCGFRQTEIDLLDWDESHVTNVGGKVCVDKDRGKTGVQIVIPFWQRTLKYLKSNAHKTGKFFTFEGTDEKAAIACIGKRWNKIKRQVAKKLPDAKGYNFENLRDTGASFIKTVNPFLVPLYLGQTTKGDAAMYVSEIKDEDGKAIVPMFLDEALAKFERYLALPK